MIQGIGAVLMLLGCIMWHIASQNKPLHSVADMWDEFNTVIFGGSG